MSYYGNLYGWAPKFKRCVYDNLYHVKAFGQKVPALGTYKKRAHKFVSKQFEFDMNTCEAWSYGWWQFVKRAGNTIYVNGARYSMQTDIHQSMADNILRIEAPEEFGLKVVYVRYREGLNHLDRAIQNTKYDIEKLKEDMAKPRAWKKTNKWRVQRIKELERHIVRTKALELRLRGGK